MTAQGTAIIAGTADGPVLRLAAPISFWGGVDPKSGKITQPTHPDFEASVAGKILFLPGAIGSSSSSAIMLELMRIGKAPSALIMQQVDAILSLGVVVAKEMGYGTIPVVEISQFDFSNGDQVVVTDSGLIARRD